MFMYHIDQAYELAYFNSNIIQILVMLTLKPYLRLIIMMTVCNRIRYMLKVVLTDSWTTFGPYKIYYNV